jgi:toxin ParE1/3/4
MARATLAKKARRDLIEIKQYTVERWGKEQARKYIGQIRDCADDLANHRCHGKLREDIAPDLKSYHVGRHVIFYVESKTGIDVARVLYDSMDFAKQFS